MWETKAPAGADPNRIIHCTKCKSDKCTIRHLETHIDRYGCHNKACRLHLGSIHVDPWEGALYPWDRAPEPDDEFGELDSRGEPREKQGHRRDGGYGDSEATLRGRGRDRDSRYTQESTTSWGGSTLRPSSPADGRFTSDYGRSRGGATSFMGSSSPFGGRDPLGDGLFTRGRARNEGPLPLGGDGSFDDEFFTRGRTRTMDRNDPFSGRDPFDHEFFTRARTTSKTFGGSRTKADFHSNSPFTSSPLVDEQRLRERMAPRNTGTSTGTRMFGFSSRRREPAPRRAADPRRAPDSRRAPAPSPTPAPPRQSRSRAGERNAGLQYVYAGTEGPDGEILSTRTFR